MKKRIIALLLCGLSCFLVFTACSRDVEPYTTEETTTTEKVTETTETTTEKVTETTTEKPKNMYRITGDINIREEPNSVSDIVGTLKKGDTVEILDIDKNDWAKIIYKSKPAYISSVYIKKIEPETTEVSKDFEDPTAGKRKIIDPTAGNPYLVVVNMTREMPSDYEPELEEIFDTGYYMEKGVAPYYEQMYLDAEKEGIILTPYSGYRSYERQKNNYINLTNDYMSKYSLSKEEAAEKAATVILPPGTSEHNLGLAMDICNTLDSFANTKEYEWLQNNAHKYGFILRYTAEKQPITGIVPEPWHWRFVGTDYAEKIKNSGLCLEEYLEKEGIAF